MSSHVALHPPTDPNPPQDENHCTTGSANKALLQNKDSETVLYVFGHKQTLVIFENSLYCVRDVYYTAVSQIVFF